MKKITQRTRVINTEFYKYVRCLTTNDFIYFRNEFDGEDMMMFENSEDMRLVSNNYFTQVGLLDSLLSENVLNLHDSKEAFESTVEYFLEISSEMYEGIEIFDLKDKEFDVIEIEHNCGVSFIAIDYKKKLIHRWTTEHRASDLDEETKIKVMEYSIGDDAYDEEAVCTNRDIFMESSLIKKVNTLKFVA